ncbi:MAG: hypothetical protein NWR72_20810, partial [Bacteroidia bacterium]|nr:hypothetical protein [Bacteroidia bacterium]
MPISNKYHRKTGDWRADLLLILAGSIVIIIAFGDIIPVFNITPLGAGLDGWKNYFTPLWYIQYDSGFHFSGMNYPYGEHVLFTDNQPLFSWILGWINQHLVDIHTYTIGILNSLELLSILGCMYFLHRIMRRLGM